MYDDLIILCRSAPAHEQWYCAGGVTIGFPDKQSEFGVSRAGAFRPSLDELNPQLWTAEFCLSIHRMLGSLSGPKEPYGEIPLERSDQRRWVEGEELVGFGERNPDFVKYFTN